MITLKLEPAQCETLEVALEEAMENCKTDDEYGYFAEILAELKAAQENFNLGHD